METSKGIINDDRLNPNMSVQDSLIFECIYQYNNTILTKEFLRRFGRSPGNQNNNTILILTKKFLVGDVGHKIYGKEGDGKGKIVNAETLEFNNRMLLERNRIATINNSETIGYFIIKHVLSEAAQKEIFPSIFELANTGEVTSQSLKDLDSYLSDEYGGSEVGDKIKSIKKNIKDLVGIPFSNIISEDKSAAFKVITLFYRIMTSNYSKVFSLLKSAYKDEINFEFRSSHPAHSSEMSERNSAIISEVKHSLLLYISSEDNAKIKKIEESLRAFFFSTSKFIHKCYHSNFLTLNDLEDAITISFSKQKLINVRIDIKLYLWIISQEYLVRSRTYVKFAEYMDSLPFGLQRGVPSPNKLSPANEKKQISKYLGYDDFELDESLNHIANKIRLWRRVEEGRDEIDEALLKAVVIHDMNLTSSVKIPLKIYGEKNPINSIRTVYKKIKNARVDYFPEALMRFFQARYESAIFKVTGRKEIYNKMLYLENLITEKIVDYIDCNDLDSILFGLNKIPEELESTLHKKQQRFASKV